jgi:hypothetical protein
MKPCLSGNAILVPRSRLSFRLSLGCDFTDIIDNQKPLNLVLAHKPIGNYTVRLFGEISVVGDTVTGLIIFQCNSDSSESEPPRPRPRMPLRIKV